MPVSIADWLGKDCYAENFGISTTIKNALLYEVQQVLEERARHGRKIEQDRKMEIEAAKPQGVSLPHPIHGISSYLK
jgi:hypothetical protein